MGYWQLFLLLTLLVIRGHCEFQQYNLVLEVADMDIGFYGHLRRIMMIIYVILLLLNPPSVRLIHQHMVVDKYLTIFRLDLSLHSLCI